MHIDKPTLFLEINDNYFVFLVVKYSDDQNYKIITHSKIVSKGLKNSKIVDVKTSSILIKDNIEKIEKEINYIFRDINIISDLNSIRCINVSGFKKLNGSQVLEENVTRLIQHEAIQQFMGIAKTKRGKITSGQSGEEFKKSKCLTTSKKRQIIKSVFSNKRYQSNQCNKRKFKENPFKTLY